MIAWLLISFFVLLFLGVPIAMSLGLSAIGGILFPVSYTHLISAWPLSECQW